MNFFGNVVATGCVAEYCGGDQTSATMMKQALEKLVDINIISNIVTRGFQGRKARMAFKDNFANFVRDTSKFIQRY